MSNAEQTYPSIAQVAAWLADYHDGAISELAPLSGGFWSSAYAYRVESEAYVLRLSDMAAGFAIDKAAMRFSGPNLPVPRVVATGTALGLNYAISERHYGRFIETTAAHEGSAVGNALASLLAALRAVPAASSARVLWYDREGAADLTWHAWLSGGLDDNPDGHVSGWRARLAENAPIDRLFEACKARFQQLLAACPERRDLIHGDLLHQNVLVADDVSRVTAIFSWKCSARGDFLFDVAWCTFWGDWHPGIAAADLWTRTFQAPDLSGSDLLDADLRHHCYELQIGASHLGWNAWTGNQKELEAVALALERTLERGPLKIKQPG